MKKRIVRFLVLILALCILLSGCAPTSRFARHVKKGEYQKAVNFYRRELYGKTLLEIESVSFLRNYLNGKWTDYLEGKIDEGAFSTVLSTVERIDSQLEILPGLHKNSSRFADIKASKESYALGLLFLEDENYLKAIEAFAGVMREDKENHAKAMEKIEQAIEIYEAGILELARERLAENDYNGAMALVAEAQNSLGEMEGFDEFLCRFHTEVFAKRFEGLVESGDDLSLVKAYNEAKANGFIAFSPEITAKYVAVRSSCIQEAIEEAEEVFLQGSDYAGAVAVLKSAVLDLGEDAELNAKLEHYEWHIPVDLVSLDYTEKTGMICVGNISPDISRDVKKTEYNDSTLIYIYSEIGSSSSSNKSDGDYVIYPLNREYTKLSGVAYRPYITSRFGGDWSNLSGRVEIFGDGSLLFSARMTEVTDEAESFEIDVTGVQELKIKMVGFWQSFYFECWPIVVVGEMLLTRD
ncbi:MAG: hypothetical protein GX763_00880 [Clostridiaceae bacterium]|nr:hypothetical protein [Clostridiaceae bacterium]